MKRTIFTDKRRNLYEYLAMGDDRKRFYRNYTILALFLFAIITAIFYGSGKSFVWRSDGLKQHYTALAYYGNYLRSILKNLFVEHTFEVPMWDLHIGYGSDILTALNYYVIGDPVSLLSVFVPERYTEYLYGLLVFLRIYLAGLAFSRYCFFHKNRQLPVLLGTMIYITSQWVLATGFDHPFFLNPCIYFPLMLLGADKILEGKKPFVYILSLGLAGIVNFYFFYMMGLLTVAYTAFRYFMVYKEWKWKAVGNLLGRFCLYSFLGIAISAVILLPVVMQVLGTGRMEAEYYISVLYSPGFYKELPTALVGTRLSRYTIIGVAGVCAMSITVLFMARKKYTGIKAGMLFLVLLFCIPYAGHVLNGFSYVSNRWSWAGVMFFAYLFVKMYPEFFLLGLAKRIILCVLSVLYGGYIVWFPKEHVIGNKLAGLVIILTGLCFLFVQGCGKTGRKRMRQVLIGSVAVSMAANVFGAFWLGKDGWERTGRHEEAGTVYETTHNSIQTALKEISGIAAYRYEKRDEPADTLYNDAMLNGLNSGQYYFSVAPDGVSDFFEANYMDNPAEQKIADLGGRSWLMKLFSMRYFVGREGEVPYGYSPVATETDLPEGIGIYEDTSALPLVYTYDSYIKEETFQSLNPAERQEAMLEGAVLSESGLPECELTFHSEEVTYKVVEEKGVRMEEDGVYVKGREGYLVLELEGLPRCETGVAFTGIRYEGIDRTDRFPFEDSSITEGNIYAGIEGGGQGRLLSLRSPKSRFQGNRTCYMLDLGYREEGVERIRIRFENPGKYSFESLKVYCQEMEPLNRLADERRQDIVKDLAAEGNTLSCSVTLEGERAVVFSIPYSKGWSLMIDGKEAELKEANGLFLAAEVGEGTHEITLKYRTPYIRAGAAISACGILGLCGVCVHRKKKD